MWTSGTPSRRSKHRKTWYSHFTWMRREGETVLNHEFLLDPRSEAELHRQIADLAASYTPEWCFCTDRPDIGSTLALLFAGQMAERIQQLNGVMEQYHAELIRLLGVTPRAPIPARGIAVVSLVRDANGPIQLPAGTQLLGRESGDAAPIVYETVEEVCLTSARLTDVVSISRYYGRILPHQGGPSRASLFPGEPVQAPKQEAGWAAISLFDFSSPGVERNAVLICHQSILEAGASAQLQVRPYSSPPDLSLADQLADPMRFRWSFYSKTGELVPFLAAVSRNGAIELERDKDGGHLSIAGGDYGAICLEALTPVNRPVVLTGLRLSSARQEAPPVFVCRNSQTLDPMRFLPFGEKATLYDECYIGDDSVFQQQGAVITVRFVLSSVETRLDLPALPQPEPLRPIKRRPKTIPPMPASACPQEVSAEYFNGLGWRPLPNAQDWVELLNGVHLGGVVLRFTCPQDWTPVMVGGYQQRCIRLRILRSDGCYLLPCIHTMPLVEQLTLSYTYPGSGLLPDLLRRICGTQVADLSPIQMDGAPFVLFEPLPYEGNALYLGLDRRPEGGPVGLFFDVSQVQGNRHFRFSYSAPTGFKPLKTADGTLELSTQGIVRFMPPADFSPLAIEGVSRYWLRLSDLENAFNQPVQTHPLIQLINMNAVSFHNVQTMEQLPFYLDHPVSNLRLSLPADGLLSVEVYVNELGRLSPAESKALTQGDSNRVKIDYDALGQIQGLYVRWTEVPSFHASQPDSRHYILDRKNGLLCFGDGVSVPAPSVCNGPAVLLQVKRCDGIRGNLPVNSIYALRGRSLYIEALTNPIAVSGGGDLENSEATQQRGANLLSGHNRLVSALDFTREALAFSSAVGKAACIVGYTPEGRAVPGQITVAVMTRDYQEGSYSFQMLKGPLRRQLLSRCGAGLAPDKLCIVQPLYVEVSLTVWISAPSDGPVFELQSQVRAAITQFLDPLGPESDSRQIGKLPTSNELSMLLESLPIPGYVQHFLAAACYTDQKGRHEAELDALASNSFAIAVPGAHQIYVEPVPSSGMERSVLS